MVQMFKNEIESHLINPGNAERSLLILTSRFFWFFFFFFVSSKTGNIYICKTTLLQYNKRDMIHEHYA